MNWLFLAAFALGVLAEAIVSSIMEAIRTTRGVLRVDHSNPDKDVYRFEFDMKHLDKMSRKRRVILRIDHNANFSQE